MYNYYHSNTISPAESYCQLYHYYIITIDSSLYYMRYISIVQCTISDTYRQFSLLSIVLHRHIDYSAASIFTPPIKTPSEYCLSDFICKVSTVHCVQPMSSRPSRGHDREGRSTVSPSSDLPAGLIPRSLVGCEDLRAQFVRLTSSSLGDMKGGQWRVDYDGVRVLTGPGVGS